jgi:hypothetical protein
VCRELLPIRWFHINWSMQSLEFRPSKFEFPLHCGLHYEGLKLLAFTCSFFKIIKPLTFVSKRRKNHSRLFIAQGDLRSLLASANAIGIRGKSKAQAYLNGVDVSDILGSVLEDMRATLLATSSGPSSSHQTDSTAADDNKADPPVKADPGVVEEVEELAKAIEGRSEWLLGLAALPMDLVKLDDGRLAVVSVVDRCTNDVSLAARRLRNAVVVATLDAVPSVRRLLGDHAMKTPVVEVDGDAEGEKLPCLPVGEVRARASREHSVSVWTCRAFRMCFRVLKACWGSGCANAISCSLLGSA